MQRGAGIAASMSRNSNIAIARLATIERTALQKPAWRLQARLPYVWTRPFFC
jgi:hypothetical protein